MNMSKLWIPRRSHAKPKAFEFILLNEINFCVREHRSDDLIADSMLKNKKTSWKIFLLGKQQ